MSQHQFFRRAAVPAEVATKMETLTFPAPTRGLIMSENESYMQPGAALVMDNWAPTMKGAKVRGGCDLWCDIYEGAVGDPYFCNVVLLMGYEGANGATGAPGMTDESPAAHGNALQVLGQAQISTAQFKFGASSLLLDGNNDMISFFASADWSLGAGLFTVECFVRPAVTSSGTQFIVGVWGATVPNFGWILSKNNTGLNFNVSTTGSDNLAILAGGTQQNVVAWHAVCVDYDGSKYRLYEDGVMVASSATPRNIFASGQALTIGSNTGSSAFWYNGNIDELRITKGVARYASDAGYTVPAAAFPRTRGSAAAFLARTSGLDATHTAAYTALLNGLDTDGLTCKLDLLQIYATQNATTALLNLVQNQYNGTANGALTFTADRGYTGVEGSTTAYVNTGFNPVTAVAPHYTQNNAHISVWQSDAVGSAYPAIGASTGAAPFDDFFNAELILTREPTGSNYSIYRLNQQLNQSYYGPVRATPLGHHMVSRVASGSGSVYYNGAAGGSVTNSSGIPNLNLYSVGCNFNGTAKGAVGRIAAISAGSNLTAADVTAFYNRLRTYMTTVGVP